MFHIFSHFFFHILEYTSYINSLFLSGVGRPRDTPRYMHPSISSAIVIPTHATDEYCGELPSVVFFFHLF